MMGSGGLGLGLDFRGEIKGEDQRDKKEVGGKREGDFWTLGNPEKKEEKKIREEGEIPSLKTLSS